MLLCRVAVSWCVRGVRRARGYRVTVLGATSEVGQAAALLLATEPLVTHLVLHDCGDHTPGVALDLSHIPRAAPLLALHGPHTLPRALHRADLVLAAAPRAPPLSAAAPDFHDNLEFVRAVVPAIARTAPLPFVGFLAEPLNVLVPIAAELMRHHGEYDPRRVFGVATVAEMRARTEYAAEGGLPPEQCDVPVLGGCSDETLVPLLSQARPQLALSAEEAARLTARVRAAWSGGAGGALGAGAGAAQWVRAVLGAAEGAGGAVHALVENNALCSGWVAGRVALGAGGAGAVRAPGPLSPYEQALLEESLRALRRDVARGRRLLETE